MKLLSVIIVSLFAVSGLASEEILSRSLMAQIQKLSVPTAKVAVDIVLVDSKQATEAFEKFATFRNLSVECGGDYPKATLDAAELSYLESQTWVQALISTTDTGNAKGSKLSPSLQTLVTSYRTAAKKHFLVLIKLNEGDSVDANSLLRQLKSTAQFVEVDGCVRGTVTVEWIQKLAAEKAVKKIALLSASAPTDAAAQPLPVAPRPGLK